mgnify:CR=1 FL=1
MEMFLEQCQVKVPAILLGERNDQLKNASVSAFREFNYVE